MFVIKWPVVGAVFFAASCGPAAQNGVKGVYQTPATTGEFDVTLVETQSAVIDGTVSFIAGREEDAGLRAFSGVIPNQPDQPDLIGNATFTGDYAVAFIDEISITDDFVTGRNTLMTGTITLNADLPQQTLSGTNGALTISSRIMNGRDLVGSVNMLGVPGELRGEIGDSRAFGAFHGADETHLFSGGFVTHRTP